MTYGNICFEPRVIGYTYEPAGDFASDRLV